MKTEIPIRFKTNYNVEMCYVADVELSRIISKLTGRKTLTERDREALKELGFTFYIVYPQYQV